jgi:hypothetical protein
MRYVKKVGIILVLLLIVGFCVENIMLHPFRGSAFDILNISEEQIIEVRINHYGKTVKITEKPQNTVFTPYLATLNYTKFSFCIIGYISHKCPIIL